MLGNRAPSQPDMLGLAYQVPSGRVVTWVDRKEQKFGVACSPIGEGLRGGLVRGAGAPSLGGQNIRNRRTSNSEVEKARGSGSV